MDIVNQFQLVHYAGDFLAVADRYLEVEKKTPVQRSAAAAAIASSLLSRLARSEGAYRRCPRRATDLQTVLTQATRDLDLKEFIEEVKSNGTLTDDVLLTAKGRVIRLASPVDLVQATHDAGSVALDVLKSITALAPEALSATERAAVSARDSLVERRFKEMRARGATMSPGHLQDARHAFLNARPNANQNRITEDQRVLKAFRENGTQVTDGKNKGVFVLQRGGAVPAVPPVEFRVGLVRYHEEFFSRETNAGGQPPSIPGNSEVLPHPDKDNLLPAEGVEAAEGEAEEGANAATVAVSVVGARDRDAGDARRALLGAVISGALLVFMARRRQAANADGDDAFKAPARGHDKTSTPDEREDDSQSPRGQFLRQQATFMASVSRWCRHERSAPLPTFSDDEPECRKRWLAFLLADKTYGGKYPSADSPLTEESMSAFVRWFWVALANTTLPSLVDRMYTALVRDENSTSDCLENLLRLSEGIDVGPRFAKAIRSWTPLEWRALRNTMLNFFPGSTAPGTIDTTQRIAPFVGDACKAPAFVVPGTVRYYAPPEGSAATVKPGPNEAMPPLTVTRQQLWHRDLANWVSLSAAVTFVEDGVLKDEVKRDVNDKGAANGGDQQNDTNAEAAKDPLLAKNVIPAANDDKVAEVGDVSAVTCREVCVIPIGATKAVEAKALANFDRGQKFPSVLLDAHTECWAGVEQKQRRTWSAGGAPIDMVAGEFEVVNFGPVVSDFNGGYAWCSATNLRLRLNDTQMANDHHSWGLDSISTPDEDLKAFKDGAKPGTFEVTKLKSPNVKATVVLTIRSAERDMPGAVALLAKFRQLMFAVRNTVLYRNVRIRDPSVFRDQKLALLHDEEIVSRTPGVFSLSNRKGELGTMYITTRRIVWYGALEHTSSVSIPYLQVGGASITESADYDSTALTIVSPKIVAGKESKEQLAHAFGFLIFPIEKARAVLQLILRFAPRSRETPFYGFTADLRCGLFARAAVVGETDADVARMAAIRKKQEARVRRSDFVLLDTLRHVQIRKIPAPETKLGESVELWAGYRTRIGVVAGFTAPVRCAQFFPSGIFVVAGEDTRLHFYDGVAEPTQTVSVHTSTVTRLAASPTGEFLASADSEAIVVCMNQRARSGRRDPTSGVVEPLWVAEVVFPHRVATSSTTGAEVVRSPEVVSMTWGATPTEWAHAGGPREWHRLPVEVGVSFNGSVKHPDPLRLLAVLFSDGHVDVLAIATPEIRPFDHEHLTAARRRVARGGDAPVLYTAMRWNHDGLYLSNATTVHFFGNDGLVATPSDAADRPPATPDLHFDEAGCGGLPDLIRFVARREQAALQQRFLLPNGGLPPGETVQAPVGNAKLEDALLAGRLAEQGRWLLCRWFPTVGPATGATLAPLPEPHQGQPPPPPQPIVTFGVAQFRAALIIRFDAPGVKSEQAGDDAAELPLVIPLPGHDGKAVIAGAFGSSTSMATSGMDGTICVWDASFLPLWALGETTATGAVDENNMSTSIATPLLRTEEGQQEPPNYQQQPEPPARGRSAPTPEEITAARSLRFPPPLVILHPGSSARSLYFGSQTQLCSSALDGKAHVWDVTNGSHIATEPFDRCAAALRVADVLSASRALATTRLNALERASNAGRTREVEALLRTGRKLAEESRFGMTLVANFDDATGFNRWYLSLFERKRLLHVLAAHTEPIACARFSPDGKTAASSSRDLSVIVWFVSTGAPKWQRREHQAVPIVLEFHRTGIMLASGDVCASDDPEMRRRAKKAAGESFEVGTIRLWDAATGFSMGSISAPETAPTSHAAQSAMNAAGDSLAHLAAVAGDADLLGVMLRGGVNPHLTCDSGYTPLHRAAQRNRKEAVALLLKHGSDPRRPVKDSADKTAVSLAATTRSFAAGEVLTQAMFQAPAIHSMVLVNNNKGVINAIDNGLTPDATDLDGRTALHLAALFGNVSLARMLLERGASSSAKTAAGELPVHLAARQNRAEVVALLLEPAWRTRDETRTDTIDGSGRTPWHYGGRLSSPGVFDALQSAWMTASEVYLLAEPDTASTALHLAAVQPWFGDWVSRATSTLDRDGLVAWDKAMTQRRNKAGYTPAALHKNMVARMGKK